MVPTRNTGAHGEVGRTQGRERETPNVPEGDEDTPIPPSYLYPLRRLYRIPPPPVPPRE